MYDRNPRYPHNFSVKRALRDSSGEIVIDAEGNPTYQQVIITMAAMSNGWMLRTSEGVPIAGNSVTSVPFGYRTNTRNLSEMGDVVNYNVTLHCPPFTTELLYDDVIEITDYDRTYRAKMVKKVTFNWGTAVWIDEIRN